MLLERLSERITYNGLPYNVSALAVYAPMNGKAKSFKFIVCQAQFGPRL